MLELLQIKNYALVKNLEIKFQDGFNVITGESGSGKTIIINALNLICGKRVEHKIIPNFDSKTVIEGIFKNNNKKVLSFLETNGIDLLNDKIIIRREILDNSISRSFINDCSVKLSKLKEIGQYLLNIHTQNENILLNKQSFHLKLIDNLTSFKFEDHKKKLLNLSNYYNKLQSLNFKLNELTSQENKSNEKLEFSKFINSEIESANIQINEKEDLESKVKLFEKRDLILNTINKISFFLRDNHESKSILDQLNELKQDLHNISKNNISFKKFIDTLNSCIIDLDDFEKEIRLLGEDYLSSDVNIENINNRLNLIKNIEFKYNVNSVEELFSLKKKIEREINDFSSLSQRIMSLKKEIKELNNTITNLAIDISKNRKKTSMNLENHVLSFLKKIYMPDVKFKVHFNKKNNFSIDGIDEVNFLFSSSIGLPINKLSKIASGGEKSRLMLAIKSIFNNFFNNFCLIFDEIDNGISGKIAVRYGEEFVNISKNNQIIVITHLPQIAAKAEHHFKVIKIKESSKYYSTIKKLNKQQRIYEISSMVSGENISKHSLNNAKSLM